MEKWRENMEMEPKKRATFALNRARRMLEAGELDAAVYCVEQSIIAAENETRRATIQECAEIAAKYFDSGEIVDEILALPETTTA